MLLQGTQMHLVTFIITSIEVTLLGIQCYYLLQRPSDKSRLWYLILLFLLVQYNTFTGLFPDENLPVPYHLQVVLAYAGGVVLSMYFAFYFYKAFKLEHLKFFAFYGSILFLFLPFLFAFIIPYYLTDDLVLSRKLIVIVPFFYALVFLFHVAKAFKIKYNNEESKEEDPLYKEKIVSVLLALLFWMCLPIITFFGDFQVIEVCLTNTGFLIMTITYIRSSIVRSKLEYKELLESKREYQKLNRNLHKTVDERTKKLKLLNQQQINTFINLVHETKTPLTLINNSLDDYLIKHGSNAEIRIIKNCIDKLNKDITNLFDYERYKKGFNFFDHNQITDFSSLLSLRVQLFGSTARAKKILLLNRIEKGVYIKASATAIDRIINNLIENAIKYTNESGTIKVILFSKKDKIHFVVSDNGIGIKDEFHKTIFQPYFQLNSQKRNIDGMGMGLSIVNSIVKDLSGKTVVKSKEEIGTRMHLEFPVYKGMIENISKIKIVDEDSVTLSIEDIDDKIKDDSSPNILVLEDHPELLKYEGEKLSEYFNVYTARNGIEALEKVKSINRLDFVISDVMMDKMNGFQFYNELTRIPKYAHIPFIFLTAKTGSRNKLKGLEMGVIDYIEKPFNIQEVLLKVNSIINNNRKQIEAVVNQAYYNTFSINNKHELKKSKKELLTELYEKYSLTEREKEITELIIKGKTYKQIGEEINISKKTVERHVYNLFSKVEVNNKLELVNIFRVEEGGYK
ncbi:ATP-binding response regulator [Chondrinema litorale]|uniref:ATP-binding response regulator n=1 Tax=Chondrinema litorale TaxID=2994555 RepID=UPI002542E84B|nr:ATP-binding protein [Chondrinema litorale]UZR99637.1 ATP-binding protein [Chondrinema litorale]